MLDQKTGVTEVLGISLTSNSRACGEPNRRHEEYIIEQPLNDVCGACAVRANDPFVKERVGIWQHGPRFKARGPLDDLSGGSKRST